MDQAVKPIPLPFGDWRPDAPDFGNNDLVVCKNAIPKVGGYGEFKSLLPSSDALGSYPRGAIAAIDKDKNVEIYAGTATSLDKLSAGSWSDVTNTGGAYSLGAQERWEFANFGQEIIATCIDEPLQKITFGGTDFADALTSTAKPQARHIAIVADFPVLGNTWDATDGFVPEQVWWLAANSTSDADPDQATLADKQVLPNGGAVRGIVGGKWGTIFKERSIYRMSLSSLPDIFDFSEVETKRGALCAGGIVPLGRLIFYLGTDGVYVFTGTESVPIGQNKVDKFIYDDIDREYLHRVSGGLSASTGSVFWLYPGAGNIDGRPNRILIYNWKTKRWGLAEVEGNVIFGSLGQGYTLEQLDNISSSLDALPASLDSPEWVDGEYALAMFNSDHKLSFFGGSALDAVFEHGEFQPYAPESTFIDAVHPIVNGPDSVVTIQAGTRNLLSDPVSWGPAEGLNDIGLAHVMSDARYTRLRMNVSGGFTDAQGLQVYAQRSGQN